MATNVEVSVERMATGGAAVGRLGDGRVVFVQGAVAGERVIARIDTEKKRYARATMVEVLDASPDRVEPVCRHARDGSCGGCDWMFVDWASQRAFKETIVIEQLERLGGVDAPAIASRDHHRGVRTTVRCMVVGGRAGYRSRRSNRSFDAAECGAAHPLLEQLIVDGDFGAASEVTLRVGAQTGERLVLVEGAPAGVSVPGDVVVVSAADDLARAAYHERVAGRLWRISALSFFQTSSTGADALVAAVAEAVGAGSGDVIDLYGGVGLLGGAVAEDRLVASVEENPSSSADARHNLAEHVAVETTSVERWVPRNCAVVIADPPRSGLGKQAVAIVDATGADRLVLVSCDPASLGRDTALLIEQGWVYERGEVIDMFPDTSRVEVVSRFSR